MMIENQTGGCVQTLDTQTSRKRSLFTVILKSTFQMTPGEKAELAQDQLPINPCDEYFGGRVPGSVRVESDLVPFKPFSDVVLIGKAYAPSGKPVCSFLAGLQVGNLASTIAIIGDRYWKKSSGVMKTKLVPSEPEPISSVDIIYENAFGGMDLDENHRGEWSLENPIGKGFVGRKRWKYAQDKPLPNLEDPNHLIRTWRDRPRPVGFGFYGQGWSPRVEYMGTYDDAWRRERAPYLPYDFQSAFYNGAHPELQLKGYLRGDEHVGLTNLHPTGRVEFSLSGLRPRLKVFGLADHRKNHPEVERDSSIELTMNLDTLCFFPEEGLLYQVWRAARTLLKGDLERIEKLWVAWR